MEANQDRVIEARLKRAVQKAVKQLLKDIENEPTLILESDDNEAGLPEESMTDIRAWLFRRGYDHGDTDA